MHGQTDTLLCRRNSGRQPRSNDTSARYALVHLHLAIWPEKNCAVCCSEGYQPELSDSSGDSGWSDIELEDVATIKFRAVTPPWQKRNEGGCMSKQLKQRTAAAAAAATGKQWPPVDLNGLSLQGGGDNDSGGLLGVLWSEDNRETNSRLQEVSHKLDL